MYRIERVLNPTEKSKITNLIIRALPDWFEMEEGIIEYTEGVKDTDFYVAYSMNTPLGFISIKQNTPYTSEIYVMAVLKEHHNQGLGKSVLKAAEAYLVEHKIKFLMVKTLGDSHPDPYYKQTRSFYKKVGFYPLEELTEIWGKENPCLIMVKPIESFNI